MKFQQKNLKVLTHPLSHLGTACIWFLPERDMNLMQVIVGTKLKFLTLLRLVKLIFV